ncbi:hypothetical protein V6N12_076060 [Hibiscus sabdariffa]|uniref:Uncharacterized protein n=1 Tax=Hibiscus sabdariffa TaxID=183260 RepID=A0ABR2AY59_9ROSI
MLDRMRVRELPELELSNLRETESPCMRSFSPPLPNT